MTQTKETGLELRISVKGEIVTSNFESFKDHAMARIEAINYELATDEDFGQAKEDITSLKDFEATLSEAEEAMLQEMDDVYALITGSRELKELSATVRKDLNSKVTARQREIKEGLIVAGINALEIDFPGFRMELEEAIKGKRSLIKMQDAIDQLVSEENIKLKANRKLIEATREEHGEALVFGESDLMLTPTNLLAIELERRLERHREAIERQKLKEEADKAKALVEAAKPKEESLPPPEQKPTPAVVPEQSRVVSTPRYGAEITAEEEMDHFTQVIWRAFAPVKEARSGLVHPENIEKAEQFANDLREAFGRFTS